MAQTSAYIPGMCNINQAEVAYRKKAMWFGVGVSVVVFIACIVFTVNPFIAGALLFIPVYIAAIGFFQVKNKFCVSYGSKGQQNADDGSDSARAVDSADEREADKKKARTMNLQALGATLIVELVLILILMNL